MLNVRVERDVPIATETLWQVLSDFGNLSWAPGIERLEVEGEGPGMVRKVFMPGMPAIDEVLEAVDHQALRYSYTIPNGLPMPIADYRAEVQVLPLDNGQSRIHWSCTGRVTGGSKPADIQAMMEGVYQQMIDWLITAFGQPASG